MSNGATPRSPTDPLELWQQWNERASRLWLQAIEGTKEVAADPYGLYRSWVKSVSDIQEQMKASPLVGRDLKDAWQLWLKTTLEIWRKAAEMGGDPLGLSKQWLKLMEEAQAKLLAGETFPIDPFTFFRQWYDATSEQWSKIVEQIISSDQFLTYTRPFLESYASLTRTFRQASEEYFKRLQLPTISDITRIAGLIVALEEKVDKTEDALENLEDMLAKAATMETVSMLGRRLDQVATAERVASLEKRLGQLATAASVASLEKRLDQLATTERVASLEKRLDQVENKLDRVLNLLEKIEAREPRESREPAESNANTSSTGQTTPHKRSKKSTTHEEEQ
ncbi:MAG: hypothetical protein IMW89_01195 [Ktedonobacteraceae bacterium]|nr:hypothetical protein [Ktedonobacteraceae bacterium]